ncbi:MAG: class I SAM-dependent methyltransferase [Thermoplasmatota archaeon]
MRRAPNPWDRFYHQQEAPWRGERPVADLVALAAGGRVLELGCGNGKLLAPLAQAGLDVVGLDISWNALRRLDNPHRVLADAAALPFAPGTFALVLDVHCTGHLGAKGRAAAHAEQARVLAPGGHLVVERLAADDLRAGQGAAVPEEPGMRELQDGRRTHFTTAEALAADVEAAGLQVLDVEVTRRTPRFRDQRVVRESVRVVAQRPSDEAPSKAS